MEKLMVPEGKPLLKWCREDGEKNENLYYYRAGWNQIMFVRDDLPKAWCLDYEEYKLYCGDDAKLIRVVGEHHSKSFKLPCYGIEIPRLGIRAVLRDNFHDWNLAIDSDDPLVLPHKRLFAHDNQSYCFWQGFPEEWQIKDTYDKNQRRFATYFDNAHQLYTIFAMIAARKDPV